MLFWQGLTFLVITLLGYFIPPSAFVRHNPAAYIAVNGRNDSGAHSPATPGVIFKDSLVNVSTEDSQNISSVLSLGNSLGPPRLGRSMTANRLAECNDCVYKDHQGYDDSCEDGNGNACPDCQPVPFEGNQGDLRCIQDIRMTVKTPKELAAEKDVLTNAVKNFDCAKLTNEIYEANKGAVIGGVCLAIGVVAAGVGVGEVAEGFVKVTEGVQHLKEAHNFVETITPDMPSHDVIKFGVEPANMTAELYEARAADYKASEKDANSQWTRWRKKKIFVLNVVVYGMALLAEAGAMGSAGGSIVYAAHVIMMPINIANTAIGAAEYVDELEERNFLKKELEMKCSTQALKIEQAKNDHLEYRSLLGLYFEDGE